MAVFNEADLRAAYIAGADKAVEVFTARGAITETPQQITQRALAVQNAALAAYPNPGLPPRVLVVNALDGTPYSFRVVAGKLERLADGVWRQAGSSAFGVVTDLFGAAGLTALAGLYTNPT